MMTPEEYAAAVSEWAALQAKARPLADAMQATRDAMFCVTIERPTGAQHAELIKNRDPRNTRRYFNEPHAVPLHAWVNVAPGVWKQRNI